MVLNYKNLSNTPYYCQLKMISNFKKWSNSSSTIFLTKFHNQIPWVPDSCSIYSYHRYSRHVSLAFYIFFLFLSCLPFLSVFWIQPKVVSVFLFLYLFFSYNTLHTLHFHSFVKFFFFFIRVLFSIQVHYNVQLLDWERR